MTFDELEDAVYYEMVAVDLLPDCNGIENVFFFFFFFFFIYSIKKHSPITNIPSQKKKKSLQK